MKSIECARQCNSWATRFQENRGTQIGGAILPSEILGIQIDGAKFLEENGCIQIGRSKFLLENMGAI